MIRIIDEMKRLVERYPNGFESPDYDHGGLDISGSRLAALAHAKSTPISTIVTTVSSRGLYIYKT